MSLNYEPSSEPLRICVKYLFSTRVSDAGGRHDNRGGHKDRVTAHAFQPVDLATWTGLRRNVSQTGTPESLLHPKSLPHPILGYLAHKKEPPPRTLQ